MRINHNISAMNSYRNFAANGSKLNKNLEKLSTGMKINRAGDDAAGLAISEKMRVQISGIEGATKNAKDGISLVQTAEGALTEVHDMLNRMVTLAEQSANGTYDNDVDRNQLQKEVDALKTEIDRIADSTNYNGIKLLDGSLSGTSGTAAASTIKLDINLNDITLKDPESWKVKASLAANISSTTVNAMSVGQRFAYNITYEENGSEKTKSMGLTIGQDKDGTQYLVGDTGTRYNVTNNSIASVTASDLKKAFDAEFRAAGLENSFSITSGDWGAASSMIMVGREKGTSGARLKSISEAVYKQDGTLDTTADAGEKAATITIQSNASDSYYTATTPTLFNGTNQNEAEFTVNGKRYIMAKDSQDITTLDSGVTVVFGQDKAAALKNMASKISQDTGLNVTATGPSTDSLTFKAGTGTASKGGLTLQIGDTSDKFNKMTVSIEDMHAKSIGVGALNISTQDGAAQAINTIRDAVNFVSNTRGTLGALQNRLDHTINNLGVMRENIQSSESLIRDTDVAEEMMVYTKNNILNQSSQAMLAQANQLPQGVLQLLG